MNKEKKCNHYYCMFYRCPEASLKIYDGHLHCISCGKVFAKEKVQEYEESSRIYDSRASHERLVDRK